MKDKIISGVIGLIVWWLIVYAYGYFMNSSTWALNNSSISTQWWTPWSFDVSNMTDEQLEKMASRAGITVDELKAKLDSWEDLRSIMPARSNSGNFSGGGAWTWNFNNNSN